MNIDPHLIGCFLDATLKDVRYAKLLRDLSKIARFALILLRRSARNHFQIRDLSQARQNFVLHPFGKIGVVRIVAQVFQRKDGNRFFWQRRQCGR
ncbi:MAG: hypothetical protein WA183_08610, partial [Chthoniobacterales bacterium]